MLIIIIIIQIRSCNNNNNYYYYYYYYYNWFSYKWRAFVKKIDIYSGFKNSSQKFERVKLNSHQSFETFRKI